MRSSGWRAAPVVVAGAVLLAACTTTPPTRQELTPTAAPAAGAPAFAIKRQHPYSVSVAVVPGGAPPALSPPMQGELRAALEASIRDSKVFREVVAAPGAQYELVVSPSRVSTPLAGFRMTAAFEMGWTLTRISDRQVVWRRSIESTHTTEAGEAFVGVTRAKMAFEGAVRGNIVQGLNAIGELAL